MRSIAAMFTIALTLAPLPAMAKEAGALTLLKTSKWEMNYSPDACQLVGTFGSGAEQVFLKFAREQPGDSFNLELLGQVLRDSDSELPIELTFGVDGTPFKVHGLAMIRGNAEQLPLVKFQPLRFDQTAAPNDSGIVSSVTLAREAAVTAIAFRTFKGKRYRLETGSMGPPMAALRTCTDALIKSWGYDPAVESGLRRTATPTVNLGSLLHFSDLPTKDAKSGRGGLVRFRLDIDAKGLPQACHVLYRTNPDQFADLTCRLLMQRARFLPALDSAGMPVKSFYIRGVAWNLFRD